ncbi:MAG: flagellar biosynthesis anti-sigma factor FlgM [Gammaproteobacteria bacterium]|nr:flagellar biosynthesis anti-sigma factor FlgM [Gammaproteobacteria bacterium]
MAIEITGYTGSVIQNSNESKQLGGERNHQQGSVSLAVSNPTNSDTVTLTNISKQLKNIEQKIVETPVVDTQRVESIKAAINNGSFQIDSSSLATKMLAFESRLFS